MTLLPRLHRLIKASLTLALALCCNLAATAAAAPELLPDCPLDQARWLGSHNSFKPVLPPAYYQRVANRLAASMPAAQQAAARQKLQSLEYGHASLTAQLNSGLRLLELDFLKDERGGRYARPLFADDLQQALAETAPNKNAANVAAKESGVTETAANESVATATRASKNVVSKHVANKHAASGPPVAQYLPPSLATAGFKVLHLPDIDFASHCALARDCLTELRQWSEANPGHWPVLIVINVREQGAGAYLPASVLSKAASKASQAEPNQAEPGQAEPWQATDYAALEQLWLEGLGRDRLLTPDDIRRPGFTLSDSVRQHGWPTLSQAAGRFLLLFDGSAAQLALYRAGHPSLRGRLMFGNYPADTAEAALLVFNQPATQQTEIASALAQGLLVRTRSDDGNVLQPSRFQAALQSGAQFISSDFYQGAPQGEPGVQFRLPAGPFTEVLCRPAAQQRPAVHVEAATAATTAVTKPATKAVTKAAINASIKAGGTP